jgi:hypothetical protein
MIDRNLEISVGDTFKPKPKNSLYQGLTLEIVKIDNSDKPISERRFPNEGARDASRAD